MSLLVRVYAATDIDTLVSLLVIGTQKRRGYQDPGVVPLLVFGGISIVLPTVVALMCGCPNVRLP